MVLGMNCLRKCIFPLMWVGVALAAAAVFAACDGGKSQGGPDDFNEDFGSGNSYSRPNSSSSVPDVVISDEPMVEDTTEVADVKSLPKCESKNEGETFFVAKENVLYFCVGGEWRSDVAETVGVSCKDGSLIVGASDDLVSTAGGFGLDSTGVMVYRRQGVVVAGVAEKGPFLHGTSVTVTELDSLKRLADSERVHRTCITSGNGSYAFDAFDLVSPYVRVEVNGYYKNELTGGLSSELVTLLNITDLTDHDSVNVNMLTHI